MSCNAIFLPGINGGKAYTTKHVLFMAHDFHMSRVDTASYAAQMVGMFTLWNFYPVMGFIHNPMCGKIFMLMRKATISLVIRTP